MLKTILNIVENGLAIVDKKLATKFEEKFHEILTNLREAQNASPEDYTDAPLNISKEKLKDFLEAYNNVLATHRNNIKSDVR